MWNNTAVCDKQPYKKKAAKLKEKCEKDIAAYRAKGKPDAVKMGVVKAEKSKQKKRKMRRMKRKMRWRRRRKRKKS
jgi:high mobility group protein B1